MAKRMTDTCKWDKAWFRTLSPAAKCVWMFLCDKCDHAGVWDIDEGAIEHFLGEPFSVETIQTVFGSRVVRYDDKLFLPGFVEFQYGHLKPENRVHKSVLFRLQKLKIKALASPFQRATDTETDKVTDKDKDRVLALADGSKDVREKLGGLSAVEALSKTIRLRSVDPGAS